VLATNILTAKLHPLYVKEPKSGVGNSEKVRVRHFTSDSAILRDGTIKRTSFFGKICKQPPKQKNVFRFVKDVFTKHELDIQTIGSVCTDVVPAMLGNKSGFSSLMKQEIPHLQSTQCFPHRHALASKNLPPKLTNVLDISVKTINRIRGRAINHPFFKLLCSDLESEHMVLLFQKQLYCLSRTDVLTRFFELREQIKIFLEQRHCYLVEGIGIAGIQPHFSVCE